MPSFAAQSVDPAVDRSGRGARPALIPPNPERKTSAPAAKRSSAVTSSFTTAERTVVEVAIDDSCGSLKVAGPFHRLITLSTGARPPDRFADPRLETLRRVAVLICQGRASFIARADHLPCYRLLICAVPSFGCDARRRDRLSWFGRSAEEPRGRCHAIGDHPSIQRIGTAAAYSVRGIVN